MLKIAFFKQKKEKKEDLKTLIFKKKLIPAQNI